MKFFEVQWNPYRYSPFEPPKESFVSSTRANDDRTLLDLDSIELENGFQAIYPIELAYGTVAPIYGEILRWIPKDRKTPKDGWWDLFRADGSQKLLYQGKDHLSTAMEACFIEMVGDVKGTLQNGIFSHVLQGGEGKMVANGGLPQCEFQKTHGLHTQDFGKDLVTLINGLKPHEKFVHGTFDDAVPGTVVDMFHEGCFEVVGQKFRPGSTFPLNIIDQGMSFFMSFTLKVILGIPGVDRTGIAHETLNIPGLDHHHMRDPLGLGGGPNAKIPTGEVFVIRIHMKDISLEMTSRHD